MALPATDAFTAASDAALQTYSANWTISAGAFQVLAASDVVCPFGWGVESGAFWNADTFAANQYAQGALTGIINASASIGVAVRAASGGNYYGLYYSASGGGSLWLFKVVSGAWSELGAAYGLGTWSVGDVLRLEVEGTTLTPKRNGVLIAAIGTKTDSSLSSGAAGICGYDALSECNLDNWEGGNLGGGGAADVPVALLRRRRQFVIDSWR